MGVSAVRDEVHAIIDALSESELPDALTLLRELGSTNGAAPVNALPLAEGGVNGAREDDDQHDEEARMLGTPLSFDSPIWGIVGIVKDDGPMDGSINHDRYLADAYADLHDE